MRQKMDLYREQMDTFNTPERQQWCDVVTASSWRAQRAAHTLNALYQALEEVQREEKPSKLQIVCLRNQIKQIKAGVFPCTVPIGHFSKLFR